MKRRVLIKMENLSICGEIDSLCYMAQRGKPAAVMAIKTKYLVDAVKRIDSLFGLYTYEKFLENDWVELWIYKKDFMLDIIKSLPEKPNTIYDHWILGKVFGYSDEAIEEYIKKNS